VREVLGLESGLRKRINGNVTDRFGLRVLMNAVCRTAISVEAIQPRAGFLKSRMTLIKPDCDRQDRSSVGENEIVFVVVVDVCRLER